MKEFLPARARGRALIRLGSEVRERVSDQPRGGAREGCAAATRCATNASCAAVRAALREGIARSAAELSGSAARAWESSWQLRQWAPVGVAPPSCASAPEHGAPTGAATYAGAWPP